jgi:hypothetical protein
MLSSACYSNGGIPTLLARNKFSDIKIDVGLAKEKTRELDLFLKCVMCA